MLGLREDEGQTDLFLSEAFNGHDVKKFILFRIVFSSRGFRADDDDANVDSPLLGLPRR
jgi:hypothetical protein